AILARTGDPGKFLRRDLGTIPEASAMLRRGGGIAEWRSRDGVPLLAGAASMSGAPWLVVSGVPSESAYGPAAARFKRDLFWIADTARGRITRRAWAADVAVDSVDLPTELTFDQGVVGWIAREGRALFIEDVTQDPRIMVTDWAVRHGLYAFAGVPVVASGE